MSDKQAYFNGRSLFCGIGLSYLLRKTGTSFWIPFILGTLLGSIILLLVKNTNQNKLIKIISGFIMAILASSLLINMGFTLYLNETPVFILTVFACIGAFITSKSKKIPFRQVLFILFVYSLFLFILKIISLYPHINMENMLPQNALNLLDIIKYSIIFALFGTVPILSLNDLNDKKNIVTNYLVSMITIFTVAFLVVSVLGIKEAQFYRYPEYIVLKRIELLDFISNVDNIFNFVIIIDLFVTMSAGFRNMEIKGKYASIIPLALVILLTTFICYKNTPIMFLYKYTHIILFILLILILFPKKFKYISFKK
jgi:hypothetical protein